MEKALASVALKFFGFSFAMALLVVIYTNNSRMKSPRSASSSCGVDLFRVLFCGCFAGGHILTNIWMTFPRNASNIGGVDVFLICCLRWLCWRSHISKYSGDVSAECL